MRERQKEACVESGGNNEDGVEGSLFQKAHRAKVS